MTIGIVVKTISNESFRLDVEEDMLVHDFKGIVKNSTSIPEDRQRLIYRGRVLQDQSPLNEYKIEDGHTVHMVAKPADYEELQHRISEQEANVTAQQPSSQSAWQSLLALSALSGDPLMRTFPSGPEHFRRRNGTFDDSTTHESTSLEPIRQSLLTVHTLLSTMPNLSTQAPTRRGRLFFVGQWLDVKDTVNQWLEATVMEVDERLARLFVHYNGWPTRWDEWIQFDSPRIAPFRTRTINSTVHQSSPTPNHSVSHAAVTGADDIRIVLPELSRLLQSLQPVLTEAAALCEQSLQQDPVAAPARPYASGMPWYRAEVEHDREHATSVPRRSSWQRAGRSGGDAEGAVMVATATGGGAREREDTKWPAERPSLRGERDDEDRQQEQAARRRRLEDLSGQFCPVLDRLGRALTDISPHLHAFATATTATAANTAEVGGGGSGAGLAGRSSRLGPLASQSGPEASRGRASWEDGPLQSILRRRAPSPPAASFFRVPVASPARPAGGTLGGNHLDIHIHAILTPVRAHSENESSGQDAPGGPNNDTASTQNSSDEDIQGNSHPEDDDDDYSFAADEEQDTSEAVPDHINESPPLCCTEASPISLADAPPVRHVESTVSAAKSTGSAAAARHNSDESQTVAPSRLSFESAVSDEVSHSVLTAGASRAPITPPRLLSCDLNKPSQLRHQSIESSSTHNRPKKSAYAAPTSSRTGNGRSMLVPSSSASVSSSVRGNMQLMSRGDRKPAAADSGSGSGRGITAGRDRRNLVSSPPAAAARAKPTTSSGSSPHIQSSGAPSQLDTKGEVSFLQRVRRSLSFHNSATSSTLSTRAVAAPPPNVGQSERQQHSRPGSNASQRRPTRIAEK